MERSGPGYREAGGQGAATLSTLRPHLCATASLTMRLERLGTAGSEFCASRSTGCLKARPSTSLQGTKAEKWHLRPRSIKRWCRNRPCECQTPSSSSSGFTGKPRLRSSLAEGAAPLHTCLCDSNVNDRSLVLLWEVPRSRSEGEAAVILLRHFIDAQSLAVRQPHSERPAEGGTPEPVRNRPRALQGPQVVSLCELRCHAERKRTEFMTPHLGTRSLPLPGRGHLPQCQTWLATTLPSQCSLAGPAGRLSSLALDKHLPGVQRGGHGDVCPENQCQLPS